MDNLTYPVFKGLQKPLEFMGLRGRFIYWAAAAIGGAFFAFVVGNILAGTVPGLIASAILGGSLFGILIYKQRKGLYNRSKFRGTIIYQRLFPRIL